MAKKRGILNKKNNKKNKKGLHQVDWVISFGIFIIYLAWFFILAKPVANPETKESLQFDYLLNKLMANASWEVNITPLYVNSSLNEKSLPIIVDFPFEGDVLNYGMKDKYWVIENGRLMFLADFQPSMNVFYLLHSEENYTKPQQISRLYADENSARSSDMVVNFENGLITNAYYKDSPRIKGFSMAVEGSNISTAKTNFSLTKISAGYHIITPSLNNSFYIFENNTKIYCFIDSTREKHISMEYYLDKYFSYYINNQQRGNINYNSTLCDEFEEDFIQFYDDEDAVTFVFGDDVNIEMCHKNNLVLSIEKNIGNSFSYMIIFHKRDENPRRHINPYTAVFGAKDILEGLSQKRLFYLKSANYSELKDEWKIKNNFNITISNVSDTLFTFGSNLPRQSSIFSKQYNVLVLDKEGNQERAIVNILMW
ncbi:MAG: hypothetical protein N3D84_00205 [Candidatus Woesearchaeota archaeon]|nr:hypothetical protein [Candidatus Woesearchaeota archaeon]